MNQKKEQQLIEQFKKLEELITLNTQQEMALMSLKNHSSEIERNFKELSSERNRLQSEFDRATLDLGRKETDITILKDQLTIDTDTPSNNNLLKINMGQDKASCTDASCSILVKV